MFSLFSFLFVVASLLSLFYVFVLPELQKLRFRTDLSWYDLGLYGFYPSRSYVSFDYNSPDVEITKWDSRCDTSYTFLSPRGASISHPGPMILDARGELVWMEYMLGTTLDLRVQQYQGDDYLTYWHGYQDGGHGRGSWYMVCHSGGEGFPFGGEAENEADGK